MRQARDSRPSGQVNCSQKHWHTYWYGPRDVTPAQRTAKLRWLAPILVNADERSVDVTVRPVHANLTTIGVEGIDDRNSTSDD
jgi:hypothetical protein